MEEQNKRKATILMIVGVITLIALVVGATYAYFQAQIGTGDKANVTVKAGTTDDLSFSLSDLDANKEKVSDNDDTASIIIEPTQSNFAEGDNSIADGVSGTATLIAGDDDYKTEDGEFTYNVYLNITKNELQYTSYKKKIPDETPENVLSFKDEATKAEADLNEYDPRPELYLTIRQNGEEVTEGVTINGAALTYVSDVFTEDETQLGGFDITETKGLIKISVPTDIKVENGNAENHTTTDTWEITVTFMNLDTDQYLNTGKSVVGEVLIQSEEKILTLAELCTDEKVSECFTKNYKEDKTLNYHNATAASADKIENSNKVANDDSYRFSGADADVKNYVCLDSRTTGDCETDDDLYRIIGLFKNSEDEYEMKLIKAQGATTTELGDNDTATGGAYYGLYSSSYSSYQSYYKGSNWETLASYNWNKSNGTTSGNVNMWAESNLNKVNLNQFYYNYITKRATYLQGHITEHTWTTGGTSNTGDAKAVYDSELGEEKVKVDDNVCYNQGDTSTTRNCAQEDIEYKAHIGLFYISDYMYGTTPNNWTTTASSYSNTTVRNNNWLYIGMYEWSISRSSSYGHRARYVTVAGNADYYSGVDYNNSGVRPSFYLTSDAKIKEGEGSKEKPYRITFE